MCVSINECICHGIPDNTPLKRGDIVNVDVSIFKNGFHADLNETFVVGVDASNPLDAVLDEPGLRLVRGAYHCLQAAIAMCKPGVLYREVGNEITRVAKKYNLSVVKTYSGHGTGHLFHCPPNVPHYAKNKARGTMEEGHVFTIEPMINLGTWQDVTWPDDWTSTTADGLRSAQFEHTLRVTKTGVEILTGRLKESPAFEWWGDECKSIEENHTP